VLDPRFLVAMTLESDHITQEPEALTGEALLHFKTLQLSVSNTH
jgi:hypothetical protein